MFSIRIISQIFLLQYMLINVIEIKQSIYASTTTIATTTILSSNDQLASSSDKSHSRTASESEQTNPSLSSSSSSTFSSRNSLFDDDPQHQKFSSTIMNPLKEQMIRIPNSGEVVPGHVTMIGYTTPIVKVGEPIPISQYLKEQEIQSNKNLQYREEPFKSSLRLPISESSQEKLASIIARMTNTDRNKLIETEQTSSNKPMSTNTPLQILLPNDSQDQLLDLKQPFLNGLIDGDIRATLVRVDSPVSSSLVEKKPLTFYNGVATEKTNLDQLNTNVLSPFILLNDEERQQLQLFQEKQEPNAPQSIDLVEKNPLLERNFIAPLETPKPFLVYKPGFRNNHKYFQTYNLDPNVLERPLKLEEKLPNSQPILISQPNTEVQPSQKHTPTIVTTPATILSSQNLEKSSLFYDFTSPKHNVPSLNKFVPKFNMINEDHQNGLNTLPWANPQTIQTSVSGPAALISQLTHHYKLPQTLRTSIQPSQPVHFQSPVIGLAQSSFLQANLPASKSQTNVEEKSPKKSIDTKIVLQNQIKHILASSPNLSEDSRERHREAIMKAVQSLVARTTSTHHSAMMTEDGNLEQSPFSTPTTSRLSSTNHKHLSVADRFAGFPRFHPKSMLLQNPSKKSLFQSFSFPPQQNFQTSQSTQHQKDRKFLSPLLNEVYDYRRIPTLIPDTSALSQTQSAKSFIHNSEQLSRIPSSSPATAHSTMFDKYYQQANRQHQHSMIDNLAASSKLYNSNYRPVESKTISSPQFVIDENHPVFVKEQIVLPPSSQIRLAPGLLLNSESFSNSDNSLRKFSSSSSSDESSKKKFSLINESKSNRKPEFLSKFSQSNESFPRATMRATSEWWKERAFGDPNGLETFAIIA
ncbi:hypothetical protein NH340_JMT05608 [Sarcoptes scabiei]|nr:hypothetical protein NH340_JMT05608 [Sarcoptes scabiei]